MDRDREYHINHRPSRLRDPFSRFSPDRGADSSRSKYGYRRNGAESYNAVESSYREDGKREYGTRYRRYLSEDSYARQYNRVTSYSRKVSYGENYNEYNTRSRHYSSKDPSFGDARYNENTATPISRTNTRTHPNHRNAVNDVKSSRKTPSRWDEPGEDTTRTLTNTNGKMQLRYGGRRRGESVVDRWQGYDDIDMVDVKASPIERPARTRVHSPRNPQSRASSSRKFEEAGNIDYTSGINVDIKTDVGFIKTENDAMLKGASVKEQYMVEPQADVLDEHMMESNAEITDGDPLYTPESPVKRKRGRPKGAKGSKKSSTSKRAKSKEVKGEVDTETDVQATPKNTTRTRVSDRIRSSTTINSYAINTRRTEDAYEEQLKRVIAMSMEESEGTPKVATKTRNSPPDNAIDTSVRTKQSSITSLEDDVNDVDYVPTTPVSSSKASAKKARAKGSAKVTTPNKTAKATGKGRGGKRTKETLAEAAPSTPPVTEPQQPQQQVIKLIHPIQEDAVTVVNDGVGSAKLLFFEQYLDMSERMYCGKPLCVRQADDDDTAVEVKGENATNDKLAKDNTLPLKQEEPNGTVEHSDNVEQIATANDTKCTTTAAEVATTTSENKTSVEQPVDSLFEFQCSNLDLRFRVSFAMLTSELRQSQMLDLWGPKELVLFELGMFKHGKEFHEIQRNIPTKTVQEIVDMYYFWKKTNRYKLWKANRQY